MSPLSQNCGIGGLGLATGDKTRRVGPDGCSPGHRSYCCVKEARTRRSKQARVRNLELHRSKVCHLAQHRAVDDQL
jgi:hypothetical protein